MRFFSPLVLLVAALFWATGCATAPDPDPPDLNAPRESTELRIRSLDAAERSINGELVRIDELLLSLEARITEAESEEVPLSLLRLVAMNCLNTEYLDLTSLSGSSLSCRPEHLDRLEEELARRPQIARDLADEFLLLIDQVRILRGSMRERLARQPENIADHREFLAEERAALRQLETDLDRRRSLYSDAGWWRSLDSIAAQRRLLRVLDERLDALEEAIPRWSQELEERVSTLYFSLADMRRAAP